MGDAELVRNVFNPILVSSIGAKVTSVYSQFNTKGFISKASSFDAESGFKDRANIITQALTEFLPQDFVKSAQIIKSTFTPLTGEDLNWESFYYMPYALYVENHGCKKEYLDISFDLLKDITKRFTSEFAIRPFIINFPDQTLKVLTSWAKDENHHVRRLVSEGSRSRLPWAQAITAFKKDPTEPIKLLQLLRNDDSKYVQKSVANHMNDITKDNPDIALDLLARWNKENNPNTNWIVKHALRSELKKGTPKALEILGYSLSPQINISDFELSSNRIKTGGDLTLSFTVVNSGNKTENLMIDYKCHFMKANGKTAPKTFKINTKKLKKGESISIKKKQSFKLISTRKMYSGEHRIEIFINGISFDELSFELIT